MKRIYGYLYLNGDPFKDRLEITCTPNSVVTHCSLAAHQGPECVDLGTMNGQLHTVELCRCLCNWTFA